MNAIAGVSSALASRGVAFAPEIAQAAARHGLDPRLLAAVAAQETGGPGANGGSNIVGDGGHGRGLFQIDDRWHAFAKTPAAMDPSKNADYAAGMLRGLLDRYRGDVRKALSSYNAGSPDAAGTTTRWADGSTLGYADSVMRHYRQLGGNAPPDALRPASVDIGALLGEAAAERAATDGRVNALYAYRARSPRTAQPSAADTFAGIISSDDTET